MGSTQRFSCQCTTRIHGRSLHSFQSFHSLHSFTPLIHLIQDKNSFVECFSNLHSKWVNLSNNSLLLYSRSSINTINECATQSDPLEVVQKRCWVWSICLGLLIVTETELWTIERWVDRDVGCGRWMLFISHQTLISMQFCSGLQLITKASRDDKIKSDHFFSLLFFFLFLCFFVLIPCCPPSVTQTVAFAVFDTDGDG